MTIAGPAFAGKTEVGVLAVALNAVEGVDVSLVLAGARLEELGGWAADGLEPLPLSFSASSDARAQAVERAVDAARRQGLPAAAMSRC